MALVPSNENDIIGIRQALQKLSTIKLGPSSTPTFAGFTITGLTAERLIWTDANKALESKDLIDLVDGTTNEINISDDGTGGITIGIINPLIVDKGGTGIASLTDHGILLGSGTGAITPLGVATDGQIPIGSTGVDPVLNTITGSGSVLVVNSAGTITLSAIAGGVDHGGLAGLSDVADHAYALLHDGTRVLSGAWSMGNQITTNVNIDTGDIATAVTNTEWDAAFAHISADGSSHTFIDQDVRTSAMPTFAELTVSALTFGNTDTDTIESTTGQIDFTGDNIVNATDITANNKMVTGSGGISVNGGTGSLVAIKATTDDSASGFRIIDKDTAHVPLFAWQAGDAGQFVMRDQNVSKIVLLANANSYILNDNFGLGTSTPDTKLQVVGTAGFGDDAGNETLYAADGLQTMAGTARVMRSIDLEPVLATRPSANPPGEGTEDSFATHDFNPTTEESVFFHLEIPHYYADAGIIHIHFDFFVDTAPASAQSVVWGVEYKKQSIGDNFDFDAGTTIGYTQTSITTGTPANDKKVHQSSEVNLVTTGFAANDYILLRLFRDADGTGGTDDFTGDARVIDYHIELLSDKLGEAT